MDGLTRTDAGHVAVALIGEDELVGPKTLDGKAEETDISQICDTIKSSKLRLKKAKARYEYIFKYGVPTPGLRDDISVVYIDDGYYSNEKKPEKKSEPDEEQDITIAVQKDN